MERSRADFWEKMIPNEENIKIYIYIDTVRKYGKDYYQEKAKKKGEVLKYPELYLDRNWVISKVSQELDTTLRILKWILWMILTHIWTVKWWRKYYDILVKNGFEDGPTYLCKGHVTFFKKLSLEDPEFTVVLRRALIKWLSDEIKSSESTKIFHARCPYAKEVEAQKMTPKLKAETLRDLRHIDRGKDITYCPVLRGDELLNELLWKTRKFYT